MTARTSMGFTLVELLVVLLILSVLLVAAPIAFDRVLPRLERLLRGDVNDEHQVMPGNAKDRVQRAARHYHRQRFRTHANQPRFTGNGRAIVAILDDRLRFASDDLFRRASHQLGNPAIGEHNGTAGIHNQRPAI